ncbi:MAG: TatD family hydrolase, partial [bacterium]|nr:TatD family hydrolase [bacterium]
SQYSTSQRAVEMAEKYPEGVYAAIGLHPIHSGEGFSLEKYKDLAKSKKVVAIGEIGLDYKTEYVSFNRAKRRVEDESLDSSPQEKQKEVLLKQLDLAKELNLPAIIHCRMAHDDLIEILSNYSLTGTIHCFSGTWEEAQKYLGMGFYLGFNGIMFKLNLDEVIKNTPLERILIETDCPYLTPPQVEGRNEPLYVKYVVEKIAKIKNLTIEEITKITTQNAKKLFGI